MRQTLEKLGNDGRKDVILLDANLCNNYVTMKPQHEGNVGKQLGHHVRLKHPPPGALYGSVLFLLNLVASQITIVW